MGKKGKKKGGGGKKKGGKGKKGKGEVQMTWKEALLAYKINIMEKQMEDIKYELRALQDKNERHKERNERLKAEQLLYMENLLKQAKEFERKLADEDIVEKEAVIAVMMANWEAARQEDRNVADIKEKIARKETEIVLERQRVEYWLEYQESGQYDHQKQIALLKRELVDMQTSFDEMAGHLERTLTQAKTEIHTVTTETLDKQKYLATEKAISKMDKYSRQEITDNDWLEKEVQIHKNEVNVLIKDVEVVEQDNLAVMSELFECSVDDLKVSRNFFLTQFEESENLEETGILEMDLAKVSLGHRDHDEDEPPERPMSAMQRAVEDKVLSLDALVQRPAAESVPAGSEGDSQFDGDNGDEESDEDDPFNNYYHFDDEDFDDYLKLGPLELKLLSITGKQMSIYKPETPPTEELEAKKWKPDEWPVTQPMLKQTVQTPPVTRSSKRSARK